MYVFTPLPAENDKDNLILEICLHNAQKQGCTIRSRCRKKPYFINKSTNS